MACTGYVGMRVCGWVWVWVTAIDGAPRGSRAAAKAKSVPLSSMGGFGCAHVDLVIVLAGSKPQNKVAIRCQRVTMSVAVGHWTKFAQHVVG